MMNVYKKLYLPIVSIKLLPLIRCETKIIFNGGLIEGQITNIFLKGRDQALISISLLVKI